VLAGFRHYHAVGHCPVPAKPRCYRCTPDYNTRRRGFLENPTAVGWQDSERGVFLPTHKRSLGYVFQESQSVAHLDGLENNLQCCLKADRQTSNTAGSSDITGIAGQSAIYFNRMPIACPAVNGSRVAIARALVLNPEVL